EHFYQPAEMWGLVAYDRTLPTACRSCQHLHALGRLRAGTSLDAARLDIEAVHSELRRRYPADYAPGTMAPVPLRAELPPRIRPALRVLGGAAAFALPTPGPNAPTLPPARAARREHARALRPALGASRARLVRQLLAESLLLALAGGVAGVALAAAA